jgi:hypothetical protein
MTYINSLIYFLAKVWFTFVMLVALVLTAILSVPFYILEWIDKSPDDRQTLTLRNKIIELNKTSR